MTLNDLVLKPLPLASLLLATIPARADEPKNGDFDVIRDETKVRTQGPGRTVTGVRPCQAQALGTTTVVMRTITKQRQCNANQK